MVAAPETKSSPEVTASKEAEQVVEPTAAEQIKKSQSDAEKSLDEVKPKDDTKSEEAEATGSKDVSEDADESKKLEMAAEKLSLGKKSLMQNLPQQAVDHLAEACALQSSVCGDMSDTMSEYYYYYGRALLELARIEGDVLGNALSGVPEGEDLENSQVENPEKLSEEVEEEMEEGGEDSEEVEGAETEEGEESQEEEDVPSLQLAWEVLELAKTIYEKRESKSKDDILKLSQVYLKLGEVSMENENFPESINMYSECLKHQKTVLSSDDRWLAETHYQLGLAHSFADNFDEAVNHLADSITVIEDRIKNVTALLAKDKVTVSDDLDQSKLNEEQKGRVSDIKELLKLLPELQEKIADIRDSKISFAEKIKTMKAHFSGQLSGGSNGKSAFDDGASSSGFSVASDADKDAKPIATTLIRKKRKPEEEAQAVEEAKNKKPRTEVIDDKSAKEEVNGSKTEDAKPVASDGKKEESASDEKKAESPSNEEKAESVLEEKAKSASDEKKAEVAKDDAKKDENEKMDTEE